jgi:serine/threonine protein kinase
MFSLGVLIYKALFHNAEVHPEYKLPRHNNPHLLDLLSKLICFDYKKRLSIEEVIVHPYFTSSIVRALEADGQLVPSNRKYAAVKAAVRQLRNYAEEDDDLTVSRVSVVADCVSYFAVRRKSFACPRHSFRRGGRRCRRIDFHTISSVFQGYAPACMRSV